MYEYSLWILTKSCFATNLKLARLLRDETLFIQLYEYEHLLNLKLLQNFRQLIVILIFNESSLADYFQNTRTNRTYLVYSYIDTVYVDHAHRQKQSWTLQ